jgi:phytoene dehydrogenase-like protein
MNNGTQEHSDVIVVGGGLAGLAAAAYVARAGRSVTVLERSSQLGGRAMTSDLDGFKFNLGPHAVYRKGAGAKVLRELGVEYTGGVPSTSGYAIRDGELHYLSQNPVAFITTRELSARAKLAVTWLLVRIATLDPKKLRNISVRDWLARVVPQPEARVLAAALARIATYSNDSDLSAEVAAMQLQLANKGVLYVDGGWQILVDGLRAAAERAGARIVTGAAVEKIEHTDATPSVRLKDGRSLAARTVVIAASPGVVAALTDSAAARSWARDAVPVRAACLDIGLRKLPVPDRGFAFGLDAPLYCSVHTRVAKLAPEGTEMIHVAKYLAPDDRDPAAHERELEACLDLVQPGWRDELLQRRYLPDMHVIEATVHAGERGLAGRPAPQLPDAANVYIAGDWVGAEGWLSDAALASAKQAAELIIAQPVTSVQNRTPAGVA